jgi:hypothetical protein
MYIYMHLFGHKHWVPSLRRSQTDSVLTGRRVETVARDHLAQSLLREAARREQRDPVRCVIVRVPHGLGVNPV